MSILLAVLGVGFAAFCVWLGIRLVNRREKWVKWTAVVVVGVPLLYVLSIGPVSWWIAELDPNRPLAKGVPPRRLPKFYIPIGFVANKVPTIDYWLRWYVTLGAPFVVIPDGKGWKEAIR